MERVIQTETEKYRQRTNCSAVVEKELRESIDAEEQHFRKERMEHQEVMGMANEKKRVAKALAEVKDHLKKARKAHQEAENLVEV